MKITCLEHNIKYELDENYEILINGNVQGYGAEICWCVTVREDSCHRSKPMNS